MTDSQKIETLRTTLQEIADHHEDLTIAEMASMASKALTETE